MNKQHTLIINFPIKQFSSQDKNQTDLKNCYLNNKNSLLNGKCNILKLVKPKSQLNIAINKLKNKQSAAENVSSILELDHIECKITNEEIT